MIKRKTLPKGEILTKIIKLKELQSGLKNAGYSIRRTTGSHQIWSNGKHTVSVPKIKLNPMLARRLAKECNLWNIMK